MNAMMDEERGEREFKNIERKRLLDGDFRMVILVFLQNTRTLQAVRKFDKYRS